jgi:hypothetical protein
VKGLVDVGDTQSQAEHIVKSTCAVYANPDLTPGSSLQKRRMYTLGFTDVSTRLVFFMDF